MMNSISAAVGRGRRRRDQIDGNRTLGGNAVLAIRNHDSVGARNSPAYGGGHDLRHVEPQPATDPVAGQSSATRRLSDRWNSHVQHARRLLSANEAVNTTDSKVVSLAGIGDIVGMEYLLIVRENDGWPRTSTGLGSLANGAATSVVCHLRLGVDGRRRAEKHGADGGARMSNPEGVNAAHERLTYFTRGAEWSHRDVRREAARYALAAMTAREPVTDWNHRRYGLPEAGHALRGRATTVFGHNRQDRQLPGGGQLDHCHTHGARAGGLRAVPAESWTEESIAAGRGPHPRRGDVQDQARVGVEMIERAIADGLPAGLVLADSAYGDNSEFRRRVRCEGLGYAVGLHRTTTVWRLDLLGRRIVTPWRSVIWPDASGRVAFGG